MPIQKWSGNMKLIDDKITLEGLFTIVLFTNIKMNQQSQSLDYVFITQNDGTTTAKSPKGMFETMEIPNDISLLVKKINDYYDGE